MSQGPVEILDHETALQELLKGAEKLAYAVGVTLGPKGRNVIFQGDRGPVVTKDGVTVAHRIQVSDAAQDLAVKIIQQSAAKAAATTGDGTTTSTVLAYNLLKKAEECLLRGADPMSVKRGLEAACDLALRLLPEYVIESDNQTAKHVATISANGDEVIGDVVGKAFAAVGADGLVLVQKSKTAESYLEVTEGTVISKGPVSPYFLKETTRVLENVYILFANTRVAKAAPILSLAQRLKKKDPSASLLVFGAPTEGDALQFLTQNYQRDLLDCVAVDAPGVGQHHIDYLWDLAVATGGQVIGDELGIKYHGEIDLDVLGFAPKVEVTKNQTRLIGVESNPGRQARVNTLREELEAETNAMELQRIQDRLSTLSSGIAIIYVGGVTEADKGETFFRLEDALGAARTALLDGVIPGGGVVLKDLQRRLSLPEAAPEGLSEDERAGFFSAADALGAPFSLLWSNAGDPEPQEIIEKGMTFDIVSGKKVDALEAGILDPLNVTFHALASAAASAGLLISTSCILLPEDKQ